MNNPYYIRPRNPDSGVSDAYATDQSSFSGGGGNKTGAYMQAAQGAIQLGTEFGQQLGAAKSINTGVPQEQFDAYGRPVYNLGEQTQYINSINDRAMLGSTGGAIAKGAATGAAAGAALGPIGAVVGGVIGGAVGGIGNALGRKKIRRKKHKAQLRIAASQNRFNEENLGATESDLSRQAYQDQVAQNNPYGVPTNYY